MSYKSGLFPVWNAIFFTVVNTNLQANSTLLVVDEDIPPLLLCKALWVLRKVLYKCNIIIPLGFLLIFFFFLHSIQCRLFVNNCKIYKQFLSENSFYTFVFQCSSLGTWKHHVVSQQTDKSCAHWFLGITYSQPIRLQLAFWESSWHFCVHCGLDGLWTCCLRLKQW